MLLPIAVSSVADVLLDGTHINTDRCASSLRASGLRQEPLALVEPNGSGRDPECISNLPDQHLLDRTL